MTASDRCCGTCRWWVLEWCANELMNFSAREPLGHHCKRRAPSADTQCTGFAHPPAGEYCGEWEVREEPPDLVTGTLSSVTARSLTAQARKPQDST